MKTTAPDAHWLERNQRALVAELAQVRGWLDRHIARSQADGSAGAAENAAPPEEPAEDRAFASALDQLCAAFALSPFERTILLLCAGVELEAGFAALCAAAQGEARRAWPTFSLALAALPEAHWSALTPAAPLRHWRLLEVRSGDSLVTSPLQIDERILHFLTGVSYLDDRLQGLLEPVWAEQNLPPSHQEILEQMLAIWNRRASDSSFPMIQLCGPDETAQRSLAAAACAQIGMPLLALRGPDIPSASVERDALARLLARETILSRSALLLDATDLVAAENIRSVHALTSHLPGITILLAREPFRAGPRAIIPLPVGPPSAAEQQTIWHNLLGPRARQLNGQLDSVVTHFNLSRREIVAAYARLDAADEHSTALWQACRLQARQRLDGLAQRIEPAATWEDLILPEPQRQLLKEMAAQVRNRAVVYQRWGFSSKGGRGLGLSALFAGASGTGKTMAAEVLANELRLDLYHIDLSSMVSKYIGETEKNLRRIFDAAEQGGAVLLFDEADALFGKRSEVKDSHDRYANIETSYLLQRMEAYRGLAILTTNMKTALDPAFLRRIRFVVPFPFPDAAQRAEIWQRVFPSETPVEDLNLAKLSRLNVAGGHIRNVALNAAFLAADAGEPVRMKHLAHAARSEYSKLEKPLTEAEIGGWI